VDGVDEDEPRAEDEPRLREAVERLGDDAPARGVEAGLLLQLSHRTADRRFPVDGLAARDRPRATAVRGEAPSGQDSCSSHGENADALLLVDAFDRVGNSDRAAAEQVCAQAAAMHERPQQALPSHLLEVPARLAETRSPGQDVTDPERVTDEGVEVDATSRDVASRLAVSEAETAGRSQLLDHFPLDERDVAADPGIAPEACGARVTVARQPDTCGSADARARLHRRAGLGRDVDLLDVPHAGHDNDRGRMASGSRPYARAGSKRSFASRRPSGIRVGYCPVRQARQSEDAGLAVARWRPSSEM
jgi:hypothetical protein